MARVVVRAGVDEVRAGRAARALVVVLAALHVELTNGPGARLMLDERRVRERKEHVKERGQPDEEGAPARATKAKGRDLATDGPAPRRPAPRAVRPPRRAPEHGSWAGYRRRRAADSTMAPGRQHAGRPFAGEWAPVKRLLLVSRRGRSPQGASWALAEGLCSVSGAGSKTLRGSLSLGATGCFRLKTKY